MDNELETWTEKLMAEQQYRSGIFTDLKSLFARAASNYLGGFASERAGHVALARDE
jgi:hypothetical protein